MSELISRQKLIEAVKKEYYQFINYDTDLTYNRAISDAIKVIDSQPPADQWIPVSDPRRPKNGQRVVVTTDLMKGMNYINTAYYYTEKPKPWWEDEWEGEGFYQSHECGYCRREDVTAWFAVEPYNGVE